MVIASLLRFVTSARVFNQPTPLADAVGFVDSLLDAPGVELARLGTEWSVLRQLCLDKSLSSNDLPDAWLAAATHQLGEHLVTFDRDFKKLLGRSQLTVLVPASG